MQFQNANDKPNISKSIILQAVDGIFGRSFILEILCKSMLQPIFSKKLGNILYWSNVWYKLIRSPTKKLNLTANNNFGIFKNKYTGISRTAMKYIIL